MHFGMDTITWTVVKFIDENTVEAVPTTWLLGSNKCYWPPFTQEKLLVAIKKHEAPNMCWPLHKINVFRNGTFDTYVQARNKTKVAEYSSDLNSDSDVKKRRIRKKKHFSSSEDESSGQESMCIPPPPRKNESIKETSPLTSITKENLDSLEELSESIVQMNQIVTAQQNIPKGAISEVNNDSCSCCPIHKNGENIKNILKQQIFIRNICAEIMEEIREIKKKFRNESSSSILSENEKNSIFKIFQFPIDSEVMLIEIEEYLSDQNNFQSAVQELLKMGGSNVYEFIKRNMSLLMTNKFAASYSWYGAKKKEVFGKLKIAEILLEAADKTKLGVDRKATEEAIKKWLRRAKERDNIKKKL